jgi:hypothetical protein
MDPRTPTLAHDDLSDLMPPDIAAELRGRFQDAGQEVTAALFVPEEQAEAERETEGKRGSGAAEFDGAPKPSPHDELGAVVYAREVDARTDLEQMGITGIGAAAAREQNAPDYAVPMPEPMQDSPPVKDVSEVAASNPDYGQLRQEHTDATAALTSEIADLMPADSATDIYGEFQAAGPQVTNHDIDDLVPPDIRAEITDRDNTPGGPSFGL